MSEEQIEDRDVMTADEVAQWFKIPVTRVYVWRREYRLPYHQIGSTVRYLRRDVVDWLRRTRIVECD